MEKRLPLALFLAFLILFVIILFWIPGLRAFLSFLFRKLIPEREPGPGDAGGESP